MLADAEKSKLVKDTPGHDGWTWHLVSMTLVPCGNDRWYWRVNYIADPNSGGLGGLPPSLCLIVLMDETLVEPKVRDRDRQGSGEVSSGSQMPGIPTELRGHKR